MRIGFDITALRVAEGGIQRYDLNLLRALMALDRENEYLLLDYLPVRTARATPPQLAALQGPNARVVRCRGVPIRRLARWNAMRRTGLRTLAGFLDRTLLRPWGVVAQASMRRVLGRALDGLDVFHSSSVLQWRLPGACNLVTIYDLATLILPDLHSAPERELQTRKHRFAREQADQVIAISQQVKHDTVERLGIVASHVSVVYGGVGPEFRHIQDRAVVASALAPLGLAPDGYLLFVGTLDPRKNLFRLIEAYAEMRRSAPGPVPRLALAGASGWRSQEAIRSAESLGVAGDVVFLGRVPEHLLPSLYNGATVFVYPSLYEGFGLPPLEAMACGVPVIASEASAVREVVGDAAVLVDPTDSHALARALGALLEDGSMRSQLRAQGLKRARAFTWENAARSLLSVYRGSGT